MSAAAQNAQVAALVKKLDELVGRAVNKPGSWQKIDLKRAIEAIDDLAAEFEKSFANPNAVMLAMKPIADAAEREAVRKFVDEYARFVAELNETKFFEKLRQEFRDLDAALKEENDKRMHVITPAVVGGIGVVYAGMFTSLNAIIQLAIMSAKGISAAQFAATVSSPASLGVMPGLGALFGVLTSANMLLMEFGAPKGGPSAKMTPYEKVAYRLGMALTVLGTLAAVSTFVAGCVVGFPFVAVPLVVAGAVIGLGTMLYSGSLLKHASSTDKSQKTIRDIKDALKQLSAAPTKTTHLFSEGPKAKEEPTAEPSLAQYKAVDKWVASI